LSQPDANRSTPIHLDRPAFVSFLPIARPTCAGQPGGGIFLACAGFAYPQPNVDAFRPPADYSGPLANFHSAANAHHSLSDLDIYPAPDNDSFD